MTERTTVRLPPDLVRRAKRKAAKEGRSFTALIEEGLRRVVKDGRAVGPVDRTPLRVSSAAGGLQPGIDWDRLSQVAEEMDDIDDARRFL